MRRFSALILLSLLSHPVVAAQASTADASSAHHARKTWEQRFTEANQAHDGHLTLAEAKAGFKTVGKHFDEIDTSHKGYVTENDIRAWRATHKAAHHKTHPSSDQAKPAESSRLDPAAGTAPAEAAPQKMAATPGSASTPRSPAGAE